MNILPENTSKITSTIRSKVFRAETSTIVLIILAFFISKHLSPYFADMTFLLESTSIYVEYGIVALIMTFIIISGQMDLSVASVMAMAGCIMGVLYLAEVNLVVAIIIGILSGIVAGIINGLLIAKLNLPALIATIGTMALFRGVAQIFLGEHSAGNYPKWFVGIDTDKIGIIPVPLIIFIIASIVLGMLLKYTIFGRWVYYLGSNENTAKFSAVSVDTLKIFLFALSGLFSAICGIMMVSRLGVSRYDMASGGELDIITIVLLGGTDINGGKGSILGTFLAFFLVVILRTGMSVANIKAENQLTVMGTLLILAIVIPNLHKLKKSN